MLEISIKSLKKQMKKYSYEHAQLHEPDWKWMKKQPVSKEKPFRQPGELLLKTTRKSRLHTFAQHCIHTYKFTDIFSKLLLLRELHNSNNCLGPHIIRLVASRCGDCCLHTRTMALYNLSLCGSKWNSDCSCNPNLWFFLIIYYVFYCVFIICILSVCTRTEWPLISLYLEEWKEIDNF